MGLRILLVTSEFPPDVGGIGSHVAELARSLVPLTDKVVVAHPGGREPGNMDVLGSLFTVERPALFHGEPVYQWMLHRWLRSRLRRGPFDLVHVHGVRPLGATRALGRPVIFTNHSSGFLARLNASSGRQKRTAALLQHIAYLIGPSDELVEAARTLGYAGPATMIPNGVDPDRFMAAPSDMRGKLGVGADEVVILLARRLVQKNGVVWFAKAVERLRGQPVRIVVAGEGAEQKEMDAILAANGLRERTTFLGSVPNVEMPALYRAADLSVLPSLAEATSIAGLEAMATGLPLVGTRVGGIPSIIEDCVTGLLVPPRDPKALGDALLRLVQDTALRGRMGAAARVKVEREFTWDAIAKRTLAVYESCAATERA